MLGSFGHLGWWLELFSHFRLQYAVWLALCGLALLALRRAALAVATVMLAAANVLPVLQHHYGAPAAPAAEGPGLRAVLLNVYFRSGSHERVLRYVREAAPDLIVFLEVTPAWLGALRGLGDVLPYQVQAGELLVASRLPLTGLRVVPLGPADTRAILVRTQHGAESLTVIGTHTNWPLGPGIAASRNGELTALAALARSVDGPLVILGDLNVTPFSPVFSFLLSRGRLADCSAGRGWHPTWPAWFPPLYLQIDHCLVGPGVGVAGLRTGPYVGSDHYPLEVTVVPVEAASPAGGAVTASAAPPTFRR